MGLMDSALQGYDDYQRELATKAVTTDAFQLPIKYVAGFDIDFKRFDMGRFVGQAALAVFEWPPSPLEWKPVWSKAIANITDIDYVPGYLGMREAPFARQLYSLLKTEASQLLPQILLVDGCGRYHPRKCGSATQIGVELDICTIRISKSFLSLPGISEADYINDNPNDRVSRILKADSESETLANAIYPSASKHPLFVSVGHKISIRTATQIVIDCCQTRIPEPIRIADALSRRAKIEN